MTTVIKENKSYYTHYHAKTRKDGGTRSKEGKALAITKWSLEGCPMGEQLEEDGGTLYDELSSAWDSRDVRSLEAS